METDRVTSNRRRSRSRERTTATTRVSFYCRFNLSIMNNHAKTWECLSVDQYSFICSLSINSMLRTCSKVLSYRYVSMRVWSHRWNMSRRWNFLLFHCLWDLHLEQWNSARLDEISWNCNSLVELIQRSCDRCSVHDSNRARRPYFPCWMKWRERERVTREQWKSLTMSPTWLELVANGRREWTSRAAQSNASLI